MPWEYDGRSAGIIPTGKQDTSHVAAEVLKEQKGDDIFNPAPPAEMEAKIKRLNEIRSELAKLWTDLYPKQDSNYAWNPFDGPDYEKERVIRDKMCVLEEEERSIQAYLREVYEGMDSRLDRLRGGI